MRAQFSRKIRPTRRIADATAQRSISRRSDQGSTLARNAACCAGEPVRAPCFFSSAARELRFAVFHALSAASAYPGHAERTGSPPGPVTLMARRDDDETSSSSCSTTVNHTPSPGTSVCVPARSFACTGISPCFAASFPGSFRTPHTPSGTIPPVPCLGRHQATLPAQRGLLFFGEKVLLPAAPICGIARPPTETSNAPT
mmetsp:Transcript_7571/g.28432  ORF Transcript_7571/g.28432 Transcript_7571/m.28432 type:complete len:200 (+) Transcript_7571:914-1513(+)